MSAISKGTVIKEIAAALDGLGRSSNRKELEWLKKYEARLEQLEDNFLPSGSGVDSGTEIDRDRSSSSRLVLTTSFHHLNDNGFYCGWTEHEIICTATFDGFDIRVTGKNKRDIKGYLVDLFYDALTRKVRLDHETNVFTYDEDRS